MEAVFMWLAIMVPMGALIAAVMLSWPNPTRKEQEKKAEMRQHRKEQKALDRFEAKAHRLARRKLEEAVLEQRVREIAGQHVNCPANEDEEGEEWKNT